jgi:outer membrane protein, heavy metal efflux system
MSKRASILNQEIFLINRTVFRFLRYFSTVLTSFHYSLETHPESFRGSNSRGCGRYSSLRTVTEKSLRSLKPALLLAGFSITLAGCAGVQTQQEWDKVKAFSTERTGVETHWVQTEEDAKVTEGEVKKLLLEGLTEEDAIKIALINNRRLQATFEEIGVAKADLVQAGLFTNPNLSAVFRFPFGGGGTDIEAVGAFKISDLWQIPLRKKVAASRLEATLLKVSEEILNTVAEAKRAHNEYIALSRMREETGKMKSQMEELRNHLIYRQKFGFTKDIDVYMADAEALELGEELSRIEKELQVSRFRLNRMLGLSPEQFDYKVFGELPEEFRPLPDLETLITHAFSSRPDIQISKTKVEDSKRGLSLERRRIFANVEAGVAYARDPEGTDFMGPEVEIQLPIFDQNQAQIASAEYRLRQAEKELQGKMGLVREDVSTSLERISFARSRVNLIRNKLLLIRKAAVEYAEEYFNAMQLNMLYLLEARQKYFEVQRRLIEALQEQRNQEIELERTLGGKIPLPK